MRMRFCKLLFLSLLAGALAVPALAQQPTNFASNLDRLAKQATETTIVTLDRPLIELALKLMPKNDPEVAKIREAIQGVTGIYVRSFEFDREGVYQMADIEALRKQLEGPGWSRIVQVRGKDENVDVSIHLEGDKILGLVIITAEPKELTVVNIAGTIRPEQLSDLERFGVPRVGELADKKPGRKVTKEVETPKSSVQAPKPPKKDE